jgi:hypothetical protein
MIVRAGWCPASGLTTGLIAAGCVEVGFHSGTGGFLRWDDDERVSVWLRANPGNELGLFIIAADAGVVF